MMSVTEVGTVLLFGWIDDRSDALDGILCLSGEDRLEFERFGWARDFRGDLTKIAGDSQDVHLGFWCFDTARRFVLNGDRLVTVKLRLASGKILSQVIRARVLSVLGMREAVLRHQSYQTRAFASLNSREQTSERRVLSYLSHDSVGPAPVAGLVGEAAPDVFDPTEAAIATQILHRRTASQPFVTTSSRAFRCGTDAFVACTEGAMLVVGWVDDSEIELDSLQILGPGWECFAAAASVGRARRADVEASLNSNGHHHFGFWALMTGQGPIALDRDLTLEVTLTDGNVRSLTLPDTRIVSAAELRDIALGYLAGCSYYGSPQVEAQRQLDHGLGERLAVLGRAVARKLAANPFVQRFLTPSQRPRASLVICLFGRPEFLFLQVAAFSRLRGFAANYELVYVSNSPELSEVLINEAQIAHRIHGIDLTLVLLSGNTGFGIANNVGVQYCRTGRILIVNPDVFPMSTDWAMTHLDILDNRPIAETRIFGVPLYYDDGSMMHAGMFLELDTGLSSTPNGITARRMVRVEHYAKGAPATSGHYRTSRPVPAVTGAFMSIDLEWFHELGGFTEDYIFGHYEDADLCLKSLQKGVPVWLHDAGLRHLEGKGSTRQAPQEGGSIVNRWLFSQRWLDTIKDGLQGPRPLRMSEWGGVAPTSSRCPTPIVAVPPLSPNSKMRSLGELSHFPEHPPATTLLDTTSPIASVNNGSKGRRAKNPSVTEPG